MTMDFRIALKWKLLGAVAALVAAGWAGWLLLRPEATVVEAIRDRANNLVDGAVTVLAERTHPVRSEEGGRILRSNLALGGAVKAGGVLVELDPAELDLKIEQLRVDREAAQKRVEIGSATKFELINEREKLGNMDRLQKQGNLPLADLQRQERAVQQVEQKLALEKVADGLQLARIESELKAAVLRRGKMIIRSPVDGIVTDIEAEGGDLIANGQTVATLISDARIVEAKISEENYAGLRVGQKATLRFLSYGSKQYDGRVEQILPAADPLTQRYMVHLSVDIDRKLLVPGLTGEVNIVVDARDNATIIPRRALQGKTVLVVKNGRVSLRNIEVGFTSLNEVEVLRGVVPGELVIVEELDRYRDGDRVTFHRVKS